MVFLRLGVQMMSNVTRAVMVVLAMTCAAATPIDTVIDTDIATDFDDTMAVSYVLSRPDLFNLKLIQVRCAYR